MFVSKFVIHNFASHNFVSHNFVSHNKDINVLQVSAATLDEDLDEDSENDTLLVQPFPIWVVWSRCSQRLVLPSFVAL